MGFLGLVLCLCFVQNHSTSTILEEKKNNKKRHSGIGYSSKEAFCKLGTRKPPGGAKGWPKEMKGRNPFGVPTWVCSLPAWLLEVVGRIWVANAKGKAVVSFWAQFCGYLGCNPWFGEVSGELPIDYSRHWAQRGAGWFLLGSAMLSHLQDQAPRVHPF